ncbi:MAG TPA: NADH-quinone oxidoreductase subunit NuoG [Acidimicrobiales bacterium]|nr:NADH-quinone oxidoreductase subunit NuoG [Acidimicrobiales bacterium]
MSEGHMSEVRQPAGPGTAAGHTGADVPVRLVPRPTVTESAVGTAPPSPKASGASSGNAAVEGAGETVTVTIDGREVQAPAGQWIIQAADDAGIYIPRFCYHPRMKPVGMCRMCLVEVEGPRGPSLMPACYNPVADGMKISTASPMAKKAQEGVLEFLLVNHPLDCPVCDKGGECPLQDQTLAYGPGETRFVEEKRHWEKPIPLSDLVLLDRERCIQCGRCVRFADEVAGDPLIDFAERGDETEVAVFPDEPYSSYFSGNVVQICPVGALTSKPYRFKARPWDLEQVESTCTTCAVGCRVAVQSSFGEVTRLIGVDSDPVNWGWLCDKGRFVFESGRSDSRLTTPMVRRGGELVPVSWAEALSAAAEGLSRAKRSGGGDSLAVIGGSRLANEDAYAWAKAARVALGTDNIDAQLGDGLPAETVLGLPRATIDEACSAPVVLTLCGDVKEELPVAYIRLRHAVRENGTQIIELTPAATGLSRYAAATLQYRPGEVAALAAAVAGKGPVAGGVAGVDESSLTEARAHLARAANMGGTGPKVVVLVGRPSLAEPADQVAAAARFLADIPGVAFLPALRRGNVHGALDMGLAPGVLPGRVAFDAGRSWYAHHWNAELPARPGADTAGILEAAARGRIGGLVLLGADPRADFPDSGMALRGLSGARFVVAVDTHMNQSTVHADVVLPAATWAEKRGTFTNLEGRLTWLSQVVTAPGLAWPDWMIASELAARMDVDLGFNSQDDIWAEVTRLSPVHAGAAYSLVSEQQERDGVVVPLGTEDRSHRQAPRPLDPMADPGIASAELHNIAPTSMMLKASASVAMEPEADGDARPVTVSAAGGVRKDNDAPEGTAVAPAGGEAPPAKPSPMGLPPEISPSASDGSAEDQPAGQLRLVARRTLWDGGTLVRSVPNLVGLHPEAQLKVHPSVLAELGTADGEPVVIRSARGKVTVPAAGDPTLPEGTALVPWNVPGLPAGDLVDARAAVNQVTVEAAAERGASHG